MMTFTSTTREPCRWIRHQRDQVLRQTVPRRRRLLEGPCLGDHGLSADGVRLLQRTVWGASGVGEDSVPATDYLEVYGENIGPDTFDLLLVQAKIEFVPQL